MGGLTRLNTNGSPWWVRLLALLALAFRSHQFYFSHAHDVTQTLQTLRVSSSSSSSTQPSAATAAAALAATTTATATGSKRPSLGARSSGKALHKKAKLVPASKGKRKGSGGRRHNRSTTNGAVAAAAASAPKPPPDARFFWNLGVLGPLLDLREGLEMANVDVSGHTKDRGGNGGEATTATEAAVAAPAGVEVDAAVAAVDRWLTPVMSGFLQVERGCRAGERSFDVMFVSRRSRLRQGTRYTRRGIDDGGNVANFVETEQVKEAASSGVSILQECGGAGREGLGHRGRGFSRERLFFDSLLAPT